MFGQMAPMGTGAFELTLDRDMLKDVIVDHRLPIRPCGIKKVTKGRLLHSPLRIERR
jgi:hypothetical protein